MESVGAAQTVALAEVLHMVLGLIAVLCIIFAAAWVVRRMKGFSGASGASMKVLSGMSIGAKERIVLVQVGEEQILLGIAPGRVQTLHVLKEPIKAAEKSSQPEPQFLAKLQEALSSRQ